MKDITLFQIESDFHRGIDIGMCNCGKRIQTKNHKYGPEIQKYYLFVLVNRGEATLYFKNKKEKVRAHELLVMCPGETIQYVAQTPWSIQWVGLYGQTIERYMKTLGIDGEHPHRYIERYHEMEETLETLYLLGAQSTEATEARRLELIFRFLSLLSPKGQEMSRYDIAESAKRIIDYNFERDLTVEALAETLHIAPAYLARKFAQKYATSPKGYLIEKRIGYAKHLLLQTDSSIKEISLSVGYDDPLYFSRIFKKKEGIAPMAYRQREREVGEKKA